MRDKLVRGNADRGAIGINMRMQIDEARRHQLSGGIEHALRLVGGNVRFERLDQPEPDTDIALSAQRLARIEHVAALDHEIEFVVWPHRGVRRMGEGGQGESARAAKEVTTRKGRHFNSSHVFFMEGSCACPIFCVNRRNLGGGP